MAVRIPRRWQPGPRRSRSLPSGVARQYHFHQQVISIGRLVKTKLICSRLSLPVSGGKVLSDVGTCWDFGGSASWPEEAQSRRASSAPSPSQLSLQSSSVRTSKTCRERGSAPLCRSSRPVIFSTLLDVGNHPCLGPAFSL